MTQTPPFANRLRPRLQRALAMRVGLVAINLATAVTLARLLGPERYGVYVFALGVMSIVALPGQAGVPLVAVRELSYALVRGDVGRVRGIVARLRALVLGYGVWAAVGLALGTLALGAILPPGEASALLWAALLLPAFGLLPFTGAALRGLDRVSTGQAVETLLRPGVFLFVAVAALAAGAQIGVGEVMALHAMAAAIALGVGSLLLTRAVRSLPPESSALPEIARLLRTLAPFTLIAGVQLILAKTDIMMLRALRSPADVGLYHVALQGAGLALFAQQAVAMVASPAIARAWQAGHTGELQAILTASARVVFLGALPIAVGLLLFGRAGITLVFGAAFAPAYAALSILLVGRVVQSSYGAIVPLARMVGWERQMVWLVAGAAVANVMLNAALIPAHGIAGAALASILADFGWKTFLVIRARRRLGLVCWPVGAKWAARSRLEVT